MVNIKKPHWYINYSKYLAIHYSFIESVHSAQYVHVCNFKNIISINLICRVNEDWKDNHYKGSAMKVLKQYSLHRKNVQPVCSIFRTFFFLWGLRHWKANQINQWIFLYGPLRPQYDLSSDVLACKTGNTHKEANVYFD